MKLFRIGLCFIALVCDSAFAALSVTDVSAQQRYPWNGMVDVSFTITGEEGKKYATSFVARDVVGGTNLAMKTMYKADGTAAALTNQLEHGTYKWVWDAAADLPDGFDCERVAVDVNAQFSPIYMVVDLSAGSSATSYPVSYLYAVPSGGWTTAYKTTKLVLRRVPAGSNSAGGSMSKDMWVGVFEVTQKQWTLTGLDIPTSCDYESNVYPVGGFVASTISFADVVTTKSASTGRCLKFLAAIKAKVPALASARLPTRKEWEYACRAGTTTDLNNGTSLTKANLNKVACWGYWVEGATASGYAVVGSYVPNSWGLYDMHGNVAEVTSEHSNDGYWMCGGSYQDYMADCASSSKSACGFDYGRPENGMRLFAEAE